MKSEELWTMAATTTWSFRCIYLTCYIQRMPPREFTQKLLASTPAARSLAATSTYSLWNLKCLVLG